jgi:hypothetical protein
MLLVPPLKEEICFTHEIHEVPITCVTYQWMCTAPCFMMFVWLVGACFLHEIDCLQLGFGMSAAAQIIPCESYLNFFLTYLESSRISGFESVKA